MGYRENIECLRKNKLHNDVDSEEREKNEPPENGQEARSHVIQAARGAVAKMVL